VLTFNMTCDAPVWRSAEDSISVAIETAAAFLTEKS
jgi:hypothetical protein